MEGFFGGAFGKIAPGMCRLSMDGAIAIKTSNGYKSYDPETGRLTNCDNFVFQVGEEFFFLIPVMKVKPGDIILANRKPKCVIEAEENRITAVSFEDSTVEQILPERHIFMGNTYFYGKIVSMFGDRLNSDKGAGTLMKYMMLSEMMKGNGAGNGNGNGNGMNMLMPLMLMGRNPMDLFDGIFDSGDE